MLGSVIQNIACSSDYLSTWNSTYWLIGDVPRSELLWSIRWTVEKAIEYPLIVGTHRVRVIEYIKKNWG